VIYHTEKIFENVRFVCILDLTIVSPLV
jgi:hypothetical protein